MSDDVAKAIQWTGDNLEEVKQFLGEYGINFTILTSTMNGERDEKTLEVLGPPYSANLLTRKGDWIIKYDNENFGVCSKRNFERVEEK